MPITHGWSGGQYSVYRAVFGTYLLIHFVHLAPWASELFSGAGVLAEASHSPLAYLFPNVLTLYDAPAFAVGLVVAGAVAAALFAIGYGDRVAALYLWYLLACLVGRNPLILNPGLPYVGWLLLAHVFVPRSPYGSWSARGRPDPGGGWRLPAGIWGTGWLLMAAGYSYSGYTKLVSPSWLDGSAVALVLDNPLARDGLARALLLELPDPVLRVMTWGALAAELLFAPLALWRRLRPWLWTAMLAMHLSLMVLIDFVDLSLGMVVLHLFTFNPDWVRPRGGSADERIFYDGSCGLCHRWVRFVLAEDRGGSAFRFAPLDSDAFRAAVAEPARAELPDSVIVATGDGRLLARSGAILHIMGRLGGLWRVFAILLRVVPAKLMDAGYDGVAAIRYRLFARPEGACPILPPDLRARFDA